MRLVAVLLLCATLGCSSQLPRRAAHRPLTLPAGENRVELALGGGVFLGDRSEVIGRAAGVLYARGITPRLELRLPLLARYRFGGDGAQWALEGGLGGITYGSSLARFLEEDPDPRQPRRTASIELTIWPMIGVQGRVPLSDTVTWTGGLSGSVRTELRTVLEGSVTPNTALTWSPTDAFSIAATAAAAWNFEGELFPLIPAIGTGGATLWWHSHESFDLYFILNARLTEELVFSREGTDLFMSIESLVGFDWHFQ